MEFLIEGKAHYIKKEYFEAILNINKSLCHGTPSHHASALLIRSSIYFELQEFQTCLENISFCRQQASENLLQLEELEIKCLKALKNFSLYDDNPWNFFRLSYPVNSKIPCIVNCLEVVETFKFGRGVITTKQLNPGDIVAIEEPLFRMLNQESRYMRCANCMKSNKMNLIPCSGKCNSSKRFFVFVNIYYTYLKFTNFHFSL